MQQYLIRSPESLLGAMDELVDNRRFKSRTQLINVVMADFIARKRNSVDPFRRFFLGEKETDKVTAEEREEKKRQLLGQEWEKYKRQKVDLLDGNWERERVSEELEARSQELELRKQLKEEILEESRSEMESKVKTLEERLRQLEALLEK
jgi:hypothetical protein